MPNLRIRIIPFKGIDGETLLLNLDLQGIAASAGAACESRSIDPSHVLLAIGLPFEDSKSSLRFSLSKINQEKEVEVVLKVLQKIAKIKKR